jgi:hypothetical protein
VGSLINRPSDPNSSYATTATSRMFAARDIVVELAQGITVHISA